MSHLHPALPYEDLSQHPKVELVFALGLSGCHPVGSPVVQVSVDLPRAQSRRCWWWCCRMQEGVEGLQRLGLCPVFYHTIGEKLRILQTDSQISLEIQARFMHIFCLPLGCQATSLKKAPHLTRGETGSSRSSCFPKPGSPPAPHPSGNQPPWKRKF